ncbi:MAG: hypothetical protein ACXW32_12450, partial [Limisphaerales bacterium]
MAVTLVTFAQTGLGPVVDVAGTWEADPDQFSPGQDAGYFRLDLERIGQTNEAQYVDMAYRGTLSIGYTAVWLYAGEPNGPGRRMQCNVIYDLGGYVRSVYQGGSYTFFMNGTNYVQILPGEPPTPLRINFTASGLTKDLRDGKLNLTTYFSDRRGIPISSNTVDICGEVIHHRFSEFRRMVKLPAVPEELRVVGNIHGRLYSEQQTTTEETNAVHRADVFLYLQDDYISKRRANQSEEEYEAYRAQRRVRRRLVARTRIEEGNGGSFSFRDLPVYRSVVRNGTGAYELARYEIEARNAETDEEVIEAGAPPGATEILYFATGEFPNNIPDGEERALPLQPFDGIGAKRALATQLSELAPKNYKAAEDGVISYLAELEAMPVRSEAAREGLRRALWAERVARDAALFAKELNGFMIDGFASIVGDILEDVAIFNRSGLRERERRLEILEKANLEEAASKGFKTPLGNELRENLRALQNDELGIISDVSKHMKLMVEVTLSSTKAILIAKGMNETEVAPALGAVEFVLNSILNVALSQGGAGFSESAKVIIKSAQDSLFDGPGFSYSGRTKDLLEFSEQRMQSWSTANALEYEIDRMRAVWALEDLGSYSTLGLQIATMTSAASDGISTTESIAGAASALPAVRIAEIVLKIAKYANNTITFAVPAWLTLHEIPKLAREGVMGAYGETVVEPQSERMQATSMNRVQFNYYLGNDVSTKASALNAVLRTAFAAIQTNDFPLAISLGAG